MEKKQYTTPKMNIIDMKSPAVLLADSAEGAPEAVLYSDEFGFNYNPEMDNKA